MSLQSTVRDKGRVAKKQRPEKQYEIFIKINTNTYRSRIISSTNFNAQFSLFTNNMFVTLLSSTCFEH